MPRLFYPRSGSLQQELRSLVDLVLQTAGLQNLSQAAGGIWVRGSITWLEDVGSTIWTLVCTVPCIALPKMEKHTMNIFDMLKVQDYSTFLLGISSCPHFFIGSAHENSAIPPWRRAEIQTSSPTGSSRRLGSCTSSIVQLMCQTI